MGNAIENRTITVKGKEYYIPKRLTFKQLVEMEDKGFDLSKMQDAPFRVAPTILSTCCNVSFEEACNLIDDYIDEGGSFEDLIELLTSPLTNFFN